MWWLRPSLEIYTDGSFKNGCGAWAYVVVRRGKVIDEASGRVKKAGSNHMEFQAAIEALKSLSTKFKIKIYSDSRILVDAMTLTPDETTRPFAFSEQWQILQELEKNHRVTWQWVKAHSGLEFNERCDELCIAAREQRSI